MELTRGASLLTAYLSDKGLRRCDFADLLGCSRPLLTMWLGGSRRPGRTNALSIEKQTAGRVPASSWDAKILSPRPGGKAPSRRRAA